MNLEHKIATILPKNYLYLTANDRLHMALSHACVDSGYVQFFKDMVYEGHHVILDNSTIETGAPQGFEEYMEVVLNINPTEIVLPDFFPEADSTIKAAEAALDYLELIGQRDSYTVMGIPQGSTPEEWKRCAVRMLDMGVDVIGISYRYNKLFNIQRAIMVEWIRGAVGFAKKQIHLLGCNSVSEGHYALRLAIVRGIDSAVASVFTRHDMLMESWLPRPPRTLDFLTDLYSLPLLEVNIDRWRRWCCGKN